MKITLGERLGNLKDVLLNAVARWALRHCWPDTTIARIIVDKYSFKEMEHYYAEKTYRDLLHRGDV